MPRTGVQECPDKRPALSPTTSSTSLFGTGKRSTVVRHSYDSAAIIHQPYLCWAETPLSQSLQALNTTENAQGQKHNITLRAKAKPFEEEGHVVPWKSAFPVAVVG